MATIEDKFYEMFNEYVPSSGKSDTFGGELIRAMGRVEYRYWNDGDRANVGYGKETCTSDAKFLRDFAPTRDIKRLAAHVLRCRKDEYDDAVKTLRDELTRYLIAHDELFKEENTIDSRNYVKALDR